MSDRLSLIYEHLSLCRVGWFNVDDNSRQKLTEFQRDAENAGLKNAEPKLLCCPLITAQRS